MNGDVSVAAETAQRPIKVYCFPWIVQKDHTLWANDVDQKNADTVLANDIKDDNWNDDAIFYVNNKLQSNFDKLAGLPKIYSETKFEGFKRCT